MITLMLKHAALASFLVLLGAGCWYGATAENCAYTLPSEGLGFKQASRLGEEAQQRIDDLVEHGRFADVEAYFVAEAARLKAIGPRAQPFVDDALQDAEEARVAARRWQAYQEELKRYRKHCGIPEPFPLPLHCGRRAADAP